MVPKMWSGVLPEELLIPEPALPVQFKEIWHRSRAISPDRALILAVLWQAADDLQKYRFARRRQQQRLYMEAYEWVASGDRRWPYSFINLCEVLQLSPEALREGLLGDASLTRTSASPSPDGATAVEEAA